VKKKGNLLESVWIYRCADIDINGTAVCKWDYTGQGFDYQILAGPVFILIYTFAGIPISMAADAYNRKVIRKFFKIFCMPVMLRA